MCIATYGKPTCLSPERPTDSPARTRVAPQLTSKTTAPKKFVQRNTLKGRRNTSPNYDPQSVPTYRFFCVICIGVFVTVAVVLITTFPQFERANERDSNASSSHEYTTTPSPTPIPSFHAAASTAAPTLFTSTAAPTLFKQILRRPTKLSIAPTPCPTNEPTTVLPTAVPTYLEPETDMPTSSNLSELPTLSLPINTTASAESP